MNQTTPANRPATGPWTSIVLVAVLVCSTLLAAPTAAHAYSESVTWQQPTSPMMYFQKSTYNNSQLRAYVSRGEARYRIVMRAGAGNSTENECNKYTGSGDTNGGGWLPNGWYYNIDHFYKTDGNPVVRGDVWKLGAKDCHDGTPRTHLYVHSQGYSGWSNSNYSSHGCIKINQTDRAHLHDRWDGSYSEAYGDVYVY